MKKNHNGMTLVEVIVAIAVFAVMTLTIATVFSATAKMNMMTNVMNNKIDAQVSLVSKAGAPGTTLHDKITSNQDFKFKINSVTGKVKVKVVEVQKDGGGAVNDVELGKDVGANIKYFVKE